METRKAAHLPSSCDTFVVLPGLTAKGCMIFGKNSDRPSAEVQEVVYIPAKDYGSSDKVECTYIEVPQTAHTHAVILSKPAWMWGAEMGANEHGVVIGNEAVWTKLFDADAMQEEKLLGMDLVRLGLERGRSAKEAMDAITSLLQEFGQGGPCSEDNAIFLYHNSFIIADGNEAWVLETADKHWAAEKVESGVRNISNQLSIGTKIDAMSDGLKEAAQASNYWDGSGEFDFTQAYSQNLPDDTFSIIEVPAHRFACGKNLLEQFSQGNAFSLSNMFGTLRDKESGICRLGEGPTGSATTASMVSVLSPPGSKSPSCHWFTATPNPSCSVFKPFIFCADVVGTKLTVAPSYGSEDPAKVKPRFQSKVDRRHPLYKAHESIKPLPGRDVDQGIVDILMELEAQCVSDVQDFLENYTPAKEEELKELFKDIVESEYKFYQ